MEEPKYQRTDEEIEAEVACKRAEAEKMKAEAVKAAAEARKAENEAAEAELDLKVATVAYEKLSEQRRRDLTADKYRHVYKFSGEVNEKNVEKCIDELTYWHRDAPKCDIEVIFFSPGGSVIDGMALFDYIKYLQGQGHKVVTTCVGYAASMAGILLQAGTTRQMSKESYLLIHEISFGAVGSMGKVEDQVEFGHKIQKRVVDIFVDRADGKISRKKFETEWKRKDWWLDSDECLKLGFVDKVV